MTSVVVDNNNLENDNENNTTSKTTTRTTQPRKRAITLDFEGGWLLASTTTHLLSKTSKGEGRVGRCIRYAYNYFISFCIELLINPHLRYIGNTTTTTTQRQVYYTPTLEKEQLRSFSRAVGSLPPPPPNQCQK